jgi:hypothetical protein
MPTLELFRDAFPKGVVNIVSGSGRVMMPAMMKTGKIDIFSFIGSFLFHSFHVFSLSSPQEPAKRLIRFNWL